MHSNPNPSLLDESQLWVIRIRHALEEELEEDCDGLSASIASVPKPLLSVKPEAYVPQLMALGPYHHRREELREMERYKLLAAKRIQSQLPGLKFQHLVDLFASLELRIRAHYSRYLPYNAETLSWMMAIDASFLLEFLQTHAVDEPKTSLRIPSRASRSPHSSRRTSTHDMLLRDVLMLENQIPLFLPRKILELQFSSPRLGDEALAPVMVAFLNELSPFKLEHAKFHSMDIAGHSHLLELLYSFMVTRSEEPFEPVEGEDHSEQPSSRPKLIIRLFGAVRAVIAARCKALASLLIKFLVKIPWRVVSSLPAFSILKQPVEQLFSQMDPAGSDGAKMASESPLLEEIAIPSVTELASAGIRFEPTDGDASSVAFDAKAATLRLPMISLDVNSEVVVRNLVAYEAAVATGPLVLTRYVELMNGIIDTEEDAKVLRERGVVVNRLRSDVEVAEMWNGMSRSVRLTRVGALDKVIEEVNGFYNGKWRVKVRRFVKRYVVGSWEVLPIVAVLSLFVVVGLHAFWAVFGFGR